MVHAPDRVLITARIERGERIDPGIQLFFGGNVRAGCFEICLHASFDQRLQVCEQSQQNLLLAGEAACAGNRGHGRL